MKFYHYKYWNGEVSKPFAIVSTNDDCILGITSNRVLVIVDKNNKLVCEFVAPKELRPLAEKVKEFMKNPLYEIQTCLYFGSQEIYSDEDI